MVSVTILLEYLKPEGKGYTSLVSKRGLGESLVSWGLLQYKGQEDIVKSLLYYCIVVPF
jgi:hypothetical protein